MKQNKCYWFLVLFFILSCKTNYSLIQFKDLTSTFQINNLVLEKLLLEFVQKGKSNTIIHVIVEENSDLLITHIDFEAYKQSDKNKVLGYNSNYDIPIIISGKPNNQFFKRNNKIKVLKILQPKKINKYNPPIIYEPMYKKYRLENNKFVYLGNVR
ncbi:hypothetical protein [Polaribacter gochangensis]|uniref:hypothetical protein n=1 Tax=Polaribacter gochangensis TaxID=3252903 RepID=UPI003904740C